MKIYTCTTPVGKISTIYTDIFTTQLKQLGEYAEQSVIDTHLRQYILNSRTILDVGGHIGYHTLGYKKINPQVKIHVFEPQKQLFDLLNKNLFDNEIENVFSYNLAVGHTNLKVTLSDIITDGPNCNESFSYDSNKIYNLGGVSIGFGKTEVQMISLDSMDLENIDYIKVDVEGAESLVFLGAKNILQKYKPVICFEYNHKKLNSEFLNSIYGSELLSPFEVLKSFGYSQFKNIPYENVIAIHESKI